MTKANKLVAVGGVNDGKLLRWDGPTTFIQPTTWGPCKYVMTAISGWDHTVRFWREESLSVEEALAMVFAKYAKSHKRNNTAWIAPEVEEV